MSTSFLVIQAQRDLAQATTNELGAILGYDLSLVDFEALQEAGPAAASDDSGIAQGTSPSGIGSATGAATAAGVANFVGSSGLSPNSTSAVGATFPVLQQQIQQPR